MEGALATNEMGVPFRLVMMPCCGVNICWVNSRRMNYCPECGKNVFIEFRFKEWWPDPLSAILRIEEAKDE